MTLNSCLFKNRKKSAFLEVFISLHRHYCCFICNTIIINLVGATGALVIEAIFSNNFIR